MNHTTTTLKTAAALLCGLTSAAFAGEPPAAPAAADNGSMFSDFNFCSWLSSKPGTVYKDAGNPWLSEVNFFGRFHYNAAYVDGNGTNGKDWNEAYTDVRRFRLGTKIGFLNYFTLKASANFVEDQRFSGSAKPAARELDWGYQDFDEATLSFDAKRAFGVDQLDKLDLIYGRFKWHGGLEARTSSNDILTIERSALANKLYDSARPTGFAVSGVKGPWTALAGVYSSDGRTPNKDLGESIGNRANNEFIGGWNDALMYNAEIGYTATEDLRFGFEFLYNGADSAKNSLVGMNDNLLPYKWATTLSAEYTFASNAGINIEGFYGDNGNIDQHKGFGKRTDRQGAFGGLVITPYYWIVPAKLQAVAQYMYAASEEDQGIRSNSRYFRAADGGAVNSGRGNQLQSVYAGLNWLICGDNLKIQAGVQYETLQAPHVGDGNANAVSYLFGFRSNF
jgi:Phosphate-selective porin O and P